MTFILEALDCIVKALVDGSELKPQVLKTLVRELVWLLPRIGLIRAPAHIPSLLNPQKHITGPS